MDVRVARHGEDRFRISGKAQIFEAQCGWVVEDGHRQLARGFESADAGAPEWGNVAFTVNIEKADPNATLHPVWFEASAKDGSRQNELPVLLY